MKTSDILFVTAALMALIAFLFISYPIVFLLGFFGFITLLVTALCLEGGF